MGDNVFVIFFFWFRLLHYFSSILLFTSGPDHRFINMTFKGHRILMSINVCAVEFLVYGLGNLSLKINYNSLLFSLYQSHVSLSWDESDGILCCWKNDVALIFTPTRPKNFHCYKLTLLKICRNSAITSLIIFFVTHCLFLFFSRLLFKTF